MGKFLDSTGLTTLWSRIKEEDDIIQALVETVTRDLAQYDEGTPLTLTSGRSAKYVNNSGTVASNSSYAISNQVDLSKGNIYLVKPASLATGVSLCAEYTTESKDVVIEYTYTYDDDNKVLTATADYDSTLKYTYSYDEDGNLLTITDKNGVTVNSLPGYRTVSAGSYVPLFKNLSTTAPKSGYYAVLANDNCKAVFSLPSSGYPYKVIVASYGIFRSIINNKEDKAVVKKLQEEVEQLRTENDMFSQGQFADAVYDTLMESDPKEDASYGSADTSEFYDFVMVDHTATPSSNGGAPYSVLVRNNTFQYKVGGYAKTVSITEDEMSAATDTTYQRDIKVGDTVVKSFAAGEEYDAEAVVEAIKTAYTAGTAAYTDAITMESNSVTGQHVVMPWETTSQDMSIYIANTKSLWLIDHVQGKSGKVHTALLQRNTIIDGIDPTDYELKPTGLTPSAVFTITNSDSKVVTRCHFTTRVGMTNCVGSAGQGGCCSPFYNDGTYPRVNDMHQINLMTWARNNNTDADSPLPHAEGGYHALNTLICALEVEHGTKYLHNSTLFGSGISSNDSCKSETTWKSNGGMRYKKSTDTTWTYCTWDNTPKIYGSTGAKINFSTYIINCAYPKEKSMESQTVMSWAAEMGIAPNTEFTTPYGGTYTYQNVDGSASTPSSKMAVRLYKDVTFDIAAYDSDSTATTFNAEVMLRMSLYNGCSFSGDVFKYCGGGAELVADITTKEQLTGVDPVPLTFFLETDQSKWVKESNEYKDDLGDFLFDGVYKKVGSALDGGGYVKDRDAYSALKTETGGSMSTYMCAYQWSNNYFNNSTLNRRSRIALRFFASAAYSLCSLRYLFAIYSLRIASHCIAGLTQVLLGDAI